MAGRPMVVVFYATGIAVSGGPTVVNREGKDGLVGRPIPGLKAFIGRRDFQRLGKVEEGNKNFTSY